MDDLLDLISIKFQVNILHLYSRSTTEPIPVKAEILPKTFDLQEVVELPAINQAIQDAKKGIEIVEQVNGTLLVEKSVEDEP